MKLTCDLCGGELEMTVGTSGAVCRSCGLEYAPDRLREKQSEMQQYANTAPIIGNTYSVPNTAKKTAPSPKERKKMTVMWVLWGIIGLIAFIGTLTAESPEQEGTLFIGCLIALILTLIIFKPWKVYGGKP